MRVIDEVLRQLGAQRTKIAKEVAILKSIRIDLQRLSGESLDTHNKITILFSLSFMVARALRPSQSELYKLYPHYPWLQLSEISNFNYDEMERLVTQADFSDYISTIKQQLIDIINTTENQLVKDVDHLDYLDFRKIPMIVLMQLSSEIKQQLAEMPILKAVVKGKAVADLTGEERQEIARAEIQKAIQNLDKTIDLILVKVIKGEELTVDCLIFKYLDLFNSHCEELRRCFELLNENAANEEFVQWCQNCLLSGNEAVMGFLSKKNSHGYGARLKDLSTGSTCDQLVSAYVNNSIKNIFSGAKSWERFQELSVPDSLMFCNRLLVAPDRETSIKEMFIAIKLLLGKLGKNNSKLSDIQKAYLRDLLVFIADYMDSIQANDLEAGDYLKYERHLDKLTLFLEQVYHSDQIPDYKKVMGGFKDIFTADNKSGVTVFVPLAEEAFNGAISRIQSRLRDLFEELLKIVDTNLLEKKSRAIEEKFQELISIADSCVESIDLLREDDVSIARSILSTELPVFSMAIKLITTTRKSYCFIAQLAKNNGNTGQATLGYFKPGKSFSKDDNVLGFMKEQGDEVLTRFDTITMRELINTQYIYTQNRRIKSDFSISSKMRDDMLNAIDGTMKVNEFMRYYDGNSLIAADSAKTLLGIIPRFQRNALDETKISSELEELLPEIDGHFESALGALRKIVDYHIGVDHLSRGFNSCLGTLVIRRNIISVINAMSLYGKEHKSAAIKKMNQLRCLQIFGECMANIRRFGGYMDIELCGIEPSEIFQISRLRNLLYHIGMEKKLGRRILDNYIFSGEMPKELMFAAGQDSSLNDFVMRINWFNSFVNNYCQDSPLAKEFAYTYVGGLAGLLYSRLESGGVSELRQFFNSVLIYKSDACTTSLLALLHETKYNRNQLAHHLLDGSYDNYHTITDVISPLIQLVWAMLQFRDFHENVDLIREHIAKNLPVFCHMLALESVGIDGVLNHLNAMIQTIQNSAEYSLYSRVEKAATSSFHEDKCRGLGFFGSYLLHCREAEKLDHRATLLSSLKL
jgi:hypothetical protein